MGLFDKIFGNYSKKELAKIEPIKNKVLELESKYAVMSDEELGGQTAILRGKLAVWPSSCGLPRGSLTRDTSASPGNLLEIQILRPQEPLNQKFWG